MSVLKDWRTNTTGPWGSRADWRQPLPAQPKKQGYNPFINGIAKDATGAPLEGATIRCHRVEDGALVATTISAADGTWTVRPSVPGTFYIVAYKTGSPDVAGTTLQTLLQV
jgi:phage baseplate assembly protein gpV